MENRGRFQWVADVMNIRPDEHILEIGCGVGFAVQAILPLLNTGAITAIDRSPAAIKRAIQRNEFSVQNGNAEFIQTELLHLPKRSHSFDKILCSNVNLFWTKTSISKESEIIKSVLRTDGQLYLFYGPLVSHGWKKTASAITLNLQREKFRVNDPEYNPHLNCFYLIASYITNS